MSKLVVVESPYKANTKEELERNVEYARKCMEDCFNRGEYPFASHLIYTQEGITDDNISEERTLGINAGLACGQFAEKTVVYLDLGFTEGMKQGIERAKKENRPFEYRRLIDLTGKFG